ncbi:flagellar basal-body MS-ring/collar protein FliF [Scandinavium hiltneri]|uniref:flagellar basal-body MS-ring/collar protein FliF n=1 Tax=Scandinavium hiltneri TaxID=2926519 RepID=UPI0035AE84B8
MNQNLLEKARQWLAVVMAKLDGKKRIALFAAAAIAATAIISAIVLGGNYGYVALYGSQQNIPVSQVISVLDESKTPYRIDPSSGQILVAEESLSQVRMILAAKGVQALSPDGYKLMDKDEVLGSSQFVQNIRYKRSLEGEMAKSIMSLDAVENARVHLALNEDSSFVVSEQPKNSASVVVRLHYGNTLNLDQVNAIIHLVSGSVPGLTPSQVSVIDQSGNLLSDGVSGGEGSRAVTRKNDQVVKDIQAKTRASIENLLASLVGKGNYRVSVMPQIDLSTVEETQENYGDAPKVSREEKAEDRNTDQLAIGIPGSLSNRPPMAPTNAQQGKREPAALSLHTENKSDYAYDRNVKHIQHPGFTVTRLNVAVVLNRNATFVKNWHAPQIQQITTMLNTAAGIDTQRGDTLTLTMMSFVPPSESDYPKLPWWQDSDILGWAKLAGSVLLALIILLFFVRPTMKRMNAARDERKALAAAEATNQALRLDAKADTQATTDTVREFELPTLPVDEPLPSPSSGLEAKLEYLQKLAIEDTDRVAEVIRQWITSNERIENK